MHDPNDPWATMYPAEHAVHAEAEDLRWPEGHTSQFRPKGLYVEAEHAEHVDEELGCVPTAQLEHEDAPAARETYGAEHGVHCVEAADDVYVPAAHAVQVVAALVDAYLPTPQLKHADKPVILAK